MKLLFAIFAICVCSVYSEVFDRPCRTDVPAKENFSTLFYLGTWFELFYNDHSFEGECITHHYTRRAENTFDVDSRFNFDGEVRQIEAVVSIAFPEERPLRAIFNGTAFFEEEPFDYVYQVYASDYTNYSILWVCHDIEDDRSVENVAVLSRSTSLSPSTLSKIDSLLAQIGFDRNEFKDVRHDDETCFFEPEPEPTPEPEPED